MKDDNQTMTTRKTQAGTKQNMSILSPLPKLPHFCHSCFFFFFSITRLPSFFLRLVLVYAYLRKYLFLRLSSPPSLTLSLYMQISFSLRTFISICLSTLRPPSLPPLVLIRPHRREA